MQELRFACVFLLLGVAASLVLSCGTRQLQSITISPATANAQNYPNEQVQFTVTGHYSTSPNAVTPLAADWGVCYQNVPTKAVSVTATGLARCGGEAGTYTVFAQDPVPSSVCCNVVNACGGGCCMVAATAHLTCP